VFAQYDETLDILVDHILSALRQSQAFMPVLNAVAHSAQSTYDSLFFLAMRIPNN